MSQRDNIDIEITVTAFIADIFRGDILEGTMGGKRSWPLSVYLLKPEITDGDAAIRKISNIRRMQIGRGRGAIGVLFYRTTPSRPPRWIEFFDDYVKSHDFSSSSVAAVLIVRTSGRLFAITFGHGRHLLVQGSYEEDFGLRTTLNSVSPDRIGAIDRKALDATGRHSKEQASRNIPIFEFGLDIDKDILRAVMGPPEDGSLGSRLSGADALAAVVEVNIGNLRDLLDTYLRQAGKDIYRSRFPWVDNIREVGSPKIKEELESELVKKIRERELERIWMAVPDLVDWHDVAGFSFNRESRDRLFDDISFEIYLGHIRNPDDVKISHLRNHRVYCISAETDMPKASWSIYKFIYAELDRNDRTYLLTSGRWYEIARDYVREVDVAIRRIGRSKDLGLPTYEDKSETEYNLRVHSRNPKTFALMDRKLVRYGGGSSQIEFCDLYSNRKQIIHVKRYGGSGTLSHLFAQGLVSAQLFLSDKIFRGAVDDLLPNSHKLRNASESIQPTGFEVAYVVISKYPDPLLLPFFSRVTLRYAATNLRNLGYSVTLTNVPTN